MTQFSTFVDILRFRAQHQPGQTAYTFLTDGERQEHSITYKELDHRARTIAAALQAKRAFGKRVLLLYPAGLEYVSAFLGCVYAGAIAVPAYPPDPTRLNKTLPRLQAIVGSSQATIVLSDSKILSFFRQMKRFNKFSEFPGLGKLSNFVLGRFGLTGLGNLEKLDWIAGDRISSQSADHWQNPEIDEQTIAFLQYTSGSTSTPKGVILSHYNLINNERMMQQAYQTNENTIIFSWLPLYHDMGLIGTVLHPLYMGTPCFLMSPLHFLQRPLRWLNAITRYKITCAGGPNFAYDLCVRKVTEEQKKTLDLSSWTIAFNGAEPVRPATLKRFAEKFADCGFREESYFSCYGLAEASLMVSGSDPHGKVVTETFCPEQLKLGRAVVSNEENAVELVSSGYCIPDQQLEIVDPETMTPCSDNQIGEVWAKGPHISRGYWLEERKTAETFGGYLPDGTGAFLRTGDLGFLREKELYIVGRIKDLIIIGGVNHYPQDIEYTIEKCHKKIRPGCCAAFSVDIAGEERLVVVAEVYDDKQSEEVSKTIKNAIFKSHVLQPYAISLIKARSIAKTSSGKIQRHGCKNSFEANKLDLVYQWRRDTKETKRIKKKKFTSGKKTKSYKQQDQKLHHIENWLIDWLADHVGVSREEIDIDSPFNEYGLDSQDSVQFSGDIEEWLGLRLSPVLAYNYPTIKTLAAYLAQESSGTSSNPKIISEPEIKEEDQPIAIIGMGCRFPGASNLDEFWQLLENSREAIREVPKNRWDVDSLYHEQANTPGKMNTRWGGFIEDIDQFDAHFFNISKTEAESMDPQQRLLLEVSWETLENAGLPVEKLRGTRSGVFVGLSSSDYAHVCFRRPEDVNAFYGVGNAQSIAAGRLSYFFDWQGPSMVVDTACSSSLLAVHLACQSLRSGECSLALAGGVNIVLSPETTVYFSQIGAMAADGRCKAFDAAADGYVRGEGCGMVALKKLSDAVADGDKILSIIRGSAVNQDGQSNGITAPNGIAQQAVIRNALRKAKISPYDVSYIEAHGTGTALGDPIEFESLANTLCSNRAPDKGLMIGSVKTNIGHLESAAGIAGLIKVTMALINKKIPAHLHFRKPSPHINWQKYPIKIPIATTPWKTEKRIAGISSFGISGTNVHLIVAENPKAMPTSVEFSPPYLLPLSAKSDQALRLLAERYGHFLEKTNASLCDICRNAGLTRDHHNKRIAVIARDKQQMIQSLFSAASKKNSSNSVGNGKQKQKPRPIFVYTGNGPQWWGMGTELMEKEPVFENWLEKCDSIFKRYSGWSVIEAWMAGEKQSKIKQTCVAQPANVILQIALTELWKSWGVVPAAIIGHSVGEVAASYTSGALSLEDALLVCYHRSRLQQTTAGKGTMLAVEMTREQAEEVMIKQTKISLAAINGPRSVVFAGEKKELERFSAELDKDIFRKLLQVEVAYHSDQMDPLRKELLSELKDIKPFSTHTPLYSTVTGAKIAGEHLTSEYWWKNVRQPVQLAQALGSIMEDGHNLFVEIGPHPVLSGSIKECLHATEISGQTICSLYRKKPEREQMFKALAQLYQLGINPHWQILVGKGSRFVLPNYAWDKKSFWFTSHTTAKNRNGSGHAFLNKELSLPQPAWEVELNGQFLQYLQDHRIENSVVFPGAAYVEAGLAIHGKLFENQSCALEKLQFHQMLVVEPKKSQVLHLNFDNHSKLYEVYSRSEQENWHRLASGKIIAGANDSKKTIELAQIRKKCTDQVNIADFYAKLNSQGLNYGNSFQGIKDIVKNHSEALVKIEGSPDLLRKNSHIVHPTLLDSSFQVLAAVFMENESNVPMVPVAIDKVEYHYAPQEKCWGHAIIRTNNASEICGDIAICNEQGKIAVNIQGLHCRALGLEELPSNYYYQFKWQESSPVPVAQASERWLIFHSSKDFPSDIRKYFDNKNISCDFIQNNDELQDESIAKMDSEPDRLVYFAESKDVDYQDIVKQNAFLTSILRILRKKSKTPAMAIVSFDSQKVCEEDTVHNLVGASLWGLGRVIANEYPDMSCRLIDLRSTADIPLLIDELCSENHEEIALRNGKRMSHRLGLSKREVLPEKTLFFKDGEYLISGGTSGFGLSMACRMAEQGAGHLLLASRRGVVAQKDQHLVQKMEQCGAKVTMLALDVSDEQKTAQIIRERKNLRGIFHAAMVLSDGLLISLEKEHFEKVFQPKIQGAWNLHKHSMDCPLDHFVLFSSIASIFGNPGQGNYVAANCFLDALALYRRQAKLPAISINWGALAETGVLARNEDLTRQLKYMGLQAFSMSKAWNILREVMLREWQHVAVFDLNWRQWADINPGPARRPLFLELLEEDNERAEQNGTFEEIEHLISLDGKNRQIFLENILKERLASILQKSEEEIDINQAINDIGLDSLMAVDLRHSLQSEFGIEIPIVELMKGATIAQMTSSILEKLNLSAGPNPEELLAKIDEMNEEEIDHWLKQMGATS